MLLPSSFDILSATQGSDIMNYTLMHRTIPVLEIEIDEITGGIVRCGDLFHPEHLPVGVHVRKDIVDRSELNDWWSGRCIPSSRMGVKEALEVFEVSSTLQLLTKCYGLSLSDQYWTKPNDSVITWEQINFFDHEFSEDVGDVLLGRTRKNKAVNFMGPDNTSDGYLKKQWKTQNGKRYLFKNGTKPFKQQPFNEVIASRLMERLGIGHVDYMIQWQDGEPFSVCEDFVNRDTELVTAWRLMSDVKKPNNKSQYQHCVNCFCEIGITDIKQKLNEMLVVDFLIANEDRHFNNFGAIRDAETLKYLKFAPIFDNGTAFGYDLLAGSIKAGVNIGCKPFKEKHTEQIKLVDSFEWISFEKLRLFNNEIYQILAETNGLIDKERADAIVYAYNKRVDYLEKLALSQVSVIDNTKDDIEEDVAETYNN